MKKLISLIAAVSMAAAISGAAIAVDKTPAVYVDTAEIVFDDQAPVILGEGTTLVPARGVFEAMGAAVEWDGEKRQVEVTSSDNNTLVRLTIDDKTMRVYDLSELMSTLLSGRDFKAPETDFTLDVEAQIMNDRTMIPLRAISEALNADVKWNGEAYRIDINTADAPVSKAGLPGFYLTSDVTEVKAGENIDLYINARNLPENSYVSGVTAAVKYNPENFELTDAALVNGDAAIDGALGASNAEYGENCLKVVYVTIDGKTAAKADGKIMKLTFKSLNGKGDSFEISNSYDTRLGYNTSLATEKLDESGSTDLFEGADLDIDVTPVVINAAQD